MEQAIELKNQSDDYVKIEQSIRFIEEHFKDQPKAQNQSVGNAQILVDRDHRDKGLSEAEQEFVHTRQNDVVAESASGYEQ